MNLLVIDQQLHKAAIEMTVCLLHRRRQLDDDVAIFTDGGLCADQAACHHQGKMVFS